MKERKYGKKPTKRQKIMEQGIIEENVRKEMNKLNRG